MQNKNFYCIIIILLFSPPTITISSFYGWPPRRAKNMRYHSQRVAAQKTMFHEKYYLTTMNFTTQNVI